MTFVLPSLILAICSSFPLIYFTQNLIFSDSMHFDRAPVPSPTAFLQAILVALLIPGISALVPILGALQMTLVEYLNSGRAAGINVTIRESKNMRLAPLIMGATIASVYGIFIYYVMPKALFSGDTALLMDVILVIFVGYFLGLTILALNL